MTFIIFSPLLLRLCHHESLFDGTSNLKFANLTNLKQTNEAYKRSDVRHSIDISWLFDLKQFLVGYQCTIGVFYSSTLMQDVRVAIIMLFIKDCFFNQRERVTHNLIIQRRGSCQCQNAFTDMKTILLTEKLISEIL